MPVGQCKLCLLTRDLKNSHLMPRALYKKARGAGVTGNQAPLLVTQAGRKQSSYQVRDYILCGDCEHRFNVGGEKYVLEIVAKRNLNFPLLDTLQKAPPTALGAEWKVWSEASTPSVDRDKLAYFAISVFWRASVHTWEQEDGRKIRIDLGPKYNEEIRRYLMGLASVPRKASLQVIVCSDQRSHISFFAPQENEKQRDRMFIFAARGLLFFFRVSNTLRGYEKRLSSINTTNRWITMRDCSKKPVWFSPEK